AHPTVSDDVLSRIAHGEIEPKPNIDRLTERTVVFADGTEVEADIVVYCTGYKVTFPFFDESFISAPENDLPLFRRMFHPDVAAPSAPLRSGTGCRCRPGRPRPPCRPASADSPRVPSAPGRTVCAHASVFHRTAGRHSRHRGVRRAGGAPPAAGRARASVGGR